MQDTTNQKRRRRKSNENKKEKQKDFKSWVKVTGYLNKNFRRLKKKVKNENEAKWFLILGEKKTAYVSLRADMGNLFPSFCEVGERAIRNIRRAALFKTPK